jgi:hypothetical protein
MYQLTENRRLVNLTCKSLNRIDIDNIYGIIQSDWQLDWVNNEDNPTSKNKF